MPDMMAIKSDDENVLADTIETLAAFPACYRMEDGRLLVAPYNAHQKSVDWWKGWLTNMEKRGMKIGFLPLFQGWKRYLEFAQRFETDFIDQPPHRPRTLDATLDGAWAIAGILPPRELTMVTAAQIETYSPKPATRFDAERKDGTQ